MPHYQIPPHISYFRSIRKGAMKLKDIVRNIKGLVYPDLCMFCHRDMPMEGHPFCLRCKVYLPLTDHFDNSENEVLKHLWGRIIVQHAAALFYFDSRGRVKEMMHRLKYKGYRSIAIEVGKMAGSAYLTSNLFHKPDVIIPVPQHKSRHRSRGYNQSAIFGEAVSEVIGVPMREDLLIKTSTTPSQTKKSRIERVENVLGTIEVVSINELVNQHVLIVDDVITTGATIESCAKAMEKIPGLKVSVLLMAIAKG